MRRFLLLLLAGALGCTMASAREHGPDFLLAGCTVGADYACQYRVSWAGDAYGAPDSLIVGDTTASAGRRTAIGNPIAPMSFTLRWTLPAPGLSLAGIVSARLKRRGLLGPAASIGFIYSRPDVPPPPVVIDTTLYTAGLDLRPDSISTMFGRTQVLCPLVRFQTGALAVRAADANYCANVAAAIPLLSRATPAQQLVADTVCVVLSGTGGALTPLGGLPCDRVM